MINYAADTCSLTSHIALRDGLDPSRLPKVTAQGRRMSERPEVQRAISEQLA
jgi:hypothetical protein